MNDPLLSWRNEFPILSTCTYMISNSLGAMPRAVYNTLHEFADTWATLGVSAWGKPYGSNPTWWEVKGAVGDKIAPLMGAPAGSVLVHENASIANGILMSALDWSDTRRSKIVVSDMDFPSDVYSIQRMLPPHISVQVIRTRDGITLPIDELLDAIDEETRLVSLSHVLFRSAYIMPAAEIVAKAHTVGAQVLLNGYHSVGIIPVDVTAMNVDYYIGGTLKWMCGGPGGVFLYVRPDLLTTLQPKITGWFAHKNPFAFDIDHFELRDDYYRLANGTPGIAALYAIQPGVDVITQVGVEAIRAKSLRQTQLLFDLADAAGYETRTPRTEADRAGTVTVNPPHAYEVSREMLARKIVVDFRANAGIRIAPHFYNTDDEVRATVDVIGEILADGSWQKHTQGREFVT
ncbi:MAG: aminotransferase class V-fold PLP-dependent enzyme [Chloroflexi bacterium]|nr:aminotransferase class V-fold PLP-dependent enzyme [Chloroflexota bacterium]MBV6436835.1 Kynureninase [Anaerolineae bacterium]MCC6565461.1 aminotransferase class V-fold PLP-dependent enzyme [Chloroflexota bacterium]MCO6445463.1 aminotransferase class V-fold PLP-dependent enzyme [Anaerolineae bacterium]RIK19008.1 MAG: kynureninase [Chloroflexota bacterium]